MLEGANEKRHEAAVRLRGFGRSAIRMVKKAAKATFYTAPKAVLVDAPLVALGAAYAGVDYGVGKARDFGSATKEAAVSAKQAGAEFKDRKVENTKDRLANNSDRKRIMLGKFAAARVGAMNNLVDNRSIERKTRKYEQYAAKAQKAKEEMEAAMAKGANRQEQREAILSVVRVHEAQKAERMDKNARKHETLSGEADAA